MEIINLKNKKELIDTANNDESLYHNPTFISENDNVLNYCLTDNDVILGEVDYQIALDTSDIMFIYIKKEYRGVGYSKILLKNTIDELKEKGIKEVFLEVRESNEVAINLYKRFEFKEIGIRKAYYENKENAILMRKEL